MESEENSVQESEEVTLSKEEQVKEIKRKYQNFKKSLKVRSKSELISMIWEQGLDLVEMQTAAKQLFEENKELKESK